jgi:hypothetical protein
MSMKFYRDRSREQRLLSFPPMTLVALIRISHSRDEWPMAEFFSVLDSISLCFVVRICDPRSVRVF